jgi:hypothetical protein
LLESKDRSIETLGDRKKMIDMKIEIMKKEIEIVTKETRMEEETA